MNSCNCLHVGIITVSDKQSRARIAQSLLLGLRNNAFVFCGIIVFYEFLAFPFSQIGAVASQAHKHVTAGVRMRAVVHVSVYAWKCCTYDFLNLCLHITTW